MYIFFCNGPKTFITNYFGGPGKFELIDYGHHVFYSNYSNFTTARQVLQKFVMPSARPN